MYIRYIRYTKYLVLGVLGEVAPLLDGVHVHGATHVVETRDTWQKAQGKKTTPAIPTNE